MWISDGWRDFEVVDCSKGEKLERWGKYYLVRPDPQAIWDTPRTDPRWNDRNARYSRSSTGGGSWEKGNLPCSWQINYGELTFNVKPMESRCYHGGEGRTRMKTLKYANRDLWALLLGAAFLAGVIALKKFGL